jgi:hypothetical protein
MSYIFNPSLRGLLLTLLVVSFNPWPSHSQGISSKSTPKKSSKEISNRYRMGMGLHGGLVGVGADLGYQFNPMLGVRAKYSVVPIKEILVATGYEMPRKMQFSGANLMVDITAKIDHADLLIDFHPFKNAFRLSAGIGLFAENHIKVNAAFLDSTQFGEITFTPSDIGSIGLNWVLKTANPYLGVGFGRPAPKHRIGLGLDLGAFYIGPPKPEILATGMVNRTSGQSPKLQENLKDYQWLPVMSLRFAVALF